MFRKNKRDPRNTSISATPKSSTSQVVPKSPISLKSYGAASIADSFEEKSDGSDEDKKSPVATFGGLKKIKE